MDSRTTASFTGSIPEKYDKYLAHPLLEYYADDMVERFIKFNPKSILEVACGTGLVTQKILDVLPNAQIVATDLNSDMLDYARKKLNADHKLEWKVADAMQLPFDDESFDAVICQFGIMFFPDKLKAMREAYRLLKQDGIFMFDTWDSIEENPVVKIVDRILRDSFKENPPDFYTVPFSFYNKEEIQRLSREAGFKSVSIEYVNHMAESESADYVVTGLIEGNPVLLQIQERNPNMIPILKEKLKEAITEKFGDKPVRADSQAIICMCRK